MFLKVALAMCIPAGVLFAQIPQPPTEFTAAYPETSAWAIGLMAVALIAAVVMVSRMVSGNVDRALRHNEAELRSAKADIRGVDLRLTTLEAEHRVMCPLVRAVDKGAP